MGDVDVSRRNTIARVAIERIAHAWHLTADETARLIAAHGEETLSEESLSRISYIIAIWEGLAAVFGSKSELARSWVNRANDAFQGETPLAVMLRDDLTGIQKVRAYVDTHAAYG